MAEHDQLGAFIDGELTPHEAEAFRQHLATCAECQREFDAFVQLDAVASAAPSSKLARVDVPQASRAMRVVAAVTLLAAGIAVFFVVRRVTPEVPTVALAETRGVEGRVTWRAADAWRPWQPSRSSAGSAVEPISAMTLAALEARGDMRSLASAWLLSGNPARARQSLEAMPTSPDVSSDLAAIALSDGRSEEALALAQAAVDASPHHAQAAWNRAIALEHLALPLVAARAFHELAASAEPGWSQEAAARASALDAAWHASRAKTQGALDAAAQMVLAGTPMSLDAVRAMPSWARMNLRYALLTATSKERVRALVPVARALDEQLGGTWLAQVLARTEAADFSRRQVNAVKFRALVVDYYRALSATGVGPIIAKTEAGLGEQTASWVTQVSTEKAWEFMGFAIPMGRALGTRFDDYAAAVVRDGDPWLALALEQERARRALSAGDVADGERRLLELVAHAGQAPLRALQAREQLAMLLTAQHRVVEGATQGHEALRLARAQGELAATTRLLMTLADAARFRNATALATAFLEERALRQPDDCAARVYLQESIAAMAIVSLDVAKARVALETITANSTCSAALSVVGVGVLADLARLAPKEADEPRLKTALDGLRAQGVAEGEAALLEHLEGRAAVDTNPERGAALLKRSMEHARSASQVDALPRKVLAHGYGLLRSAAGESGRWAELFELTAEELGRAVPRQCALVIEVQDNRVAVAARDSQGRETGSARRFELRARETGGLSLVEISAVASPVARAAAAGCARLSVFASYPLHGRSGWLPDDVAWAYSGGGVARAPAGTSALVVRDVAAPPSLGLPKLSSWDDVVREGDAQLTGDAATPTRVLEAMKTAAFIELHVHARVNPADADTAALVLAPDESGQFALSAKTLSGTHLENAPVVLLAACRASTVAPFLHEPWSLPRAFLQAGASAVIAAPVDLPDAEARDFFAAVVARIRRGQDAASAIRDERLVFVENRRAPWVRTVLVFD